MPARINTCVRKLLERSPQMASNAAMIATRKVTEAMIEAALSRSRDYDDATEAPAATYFNSGDDYDDSRRRFSPSPAPQQPRGNALVRNC